MSENTLKTYGNKDKYVLYVSTGIGHLHECSVKRMIYSATKCLALCRISILYFSSAKKKLLPKTQVPKLQLPHKKVDNAEKRSVDFFKSQQIVRLR